MDEEAGLQEPLMPVIQEDEELSRASSTAVRSTESPFAAAQGGGFSQYGSQSLDRRSVDRAASGLGRGLPHSQSMGAADLRDFNQYSHTNKAGVASNAEARASWLRVRNKVMGHPELSRTISQLLHQPGQLQGIDFKRKHDEADLLHAALRAQCKITCVDYNASQVALREGITNETLQEFLDAPRPSWSRVRWINIDGLSWDVIQRCALHFDLHPLSVEDCVHVPQRIKADFYDHFLYVSLNLVSLVSYTTLQDAGSEPGFGPGVDEEGAPPSAWSTNSSRTPQKCSNRPGSTSQQPEPPQHQRSYSGTSSTTFQPELGKQPVRRLLSSTSMQHAGAQEKGRTASTTTPRAVEVAAEQVAIFLLEGNTIISMFQNDGGPVTRPLWAQLREARTLARDAEDASYLLNLLLDAIVDSAFPVVEAFAELIGAYESCVLERQPRPSNTRDLHVVTGDLATLRRTIQPTYNLVTALRAHAQASQEALGAMPGSPMHISPFSQAPGYAPITFAPDDSQAHSAQSPSDVATGGERGIIGNGHDEHDTHGGSIHNNALFHANGHPAMGNISSGASSPQHPFPGLPPHQHPPPPYQHHHWQPMSPHAMQQKVLISRLTKTYLSDVQDHLSSTLDSINSLSEQCRDLIALIFNLAAHQTNQSMQALTVVSVLFLPLTFLAGIYGMNFDNIPELHWEYGYAYFFCMCGVIGLVFLITMYRMGLLNGNG
uniref:Magnesium transporter n=2 Tax=Dunaliella tertiolecta TaxID=3047 RepID=A0A7S3QLE5_DUNTE